MEYHFPEDPKQSTGQGSVDQDAQLSNDLPSALRPSSVPADIDPSNSFEFAGRTFSIGFYPKDPGPRPEHSESREWLLYGFDQRLVIVDHESPADRIETGIKLGFYINDSIGGGAREWRTANCWLVERTPEKILFDIEVIVRGEYWSNQSMDDDWAPEHPALQTAQLEFSKGADGAFSVKILNSNLRYQN